MGALSRLMGRGKLPPAPPSISADEVIAQAQARAGGPQPDEPKVYGGVQVARGRTIQTLGDRIAVEPLAAFGKIGDLFVPTSQTYVRARVLSRGAKAKGVRVGEAVVVSEFFGDEVKLEDGTPEGRRVRIGRERDIVGRDTPAGIDPVGDRVLMTRIVPPAMVGLIHIPEDVNEKQFKAKVVAHGPDCRGVALGDIVMVPKHGSVVVNYAGQKLVLVDEPTILGVVRE